jgi:hypothetical protein
MKSETVYITQAITYFQMAQKQLIILGIVFGLIIFLNTTTVSAPIGFVGVFLIIFFYVAYQKQVDKLKHGGVVIDA